jgi:hypothetical protein
MRFLASLAAGALVISSAGHVRTADACGCFTPPDPSVPVVQAGERILFAMDSGKVTAHIQIQYAGDAAEFGWILPLPSVPELELGTDELFAQLTTQTQPKYRLNTVFDGNCGGRGGFGGSDGDTAAEGGPPGPATGGRPPIVVIQDSIGPYDWVVLRADDREEMLGWLAENRYFVPAGTDEAVKPYIRGGAYFLALKLRSGRSVGDLQPVVVKYDSDLPMIPIVLTSVAAQPDMGIQVWMLGEGRAIPRNYFHTVLNDATINWFTAGANYNEVIIAATKEAEGRHTFVTEYAGPSLIMRGLLDPLRRFGTKAALASQPDAISFVRYLNENGFPVPTQGNQPGPFPTQSLVYTAQLTTILGRHIPVPPGLTANDFYARIEYYLGAYRDANPTQFLGYTIDYRPVQMAEEIWTGVVTPTLEAGALFTRYPYLTRLYTTLSPEQMNRDPVFSENRSLPEVSNVHQATVTVHCGLFGGDTNELPATLVTEQGFTIEYPDGAPFVGFTPTPPPGPLPVPEPLPASMRIETVTEEGPPVVVLDNAPRIGSLLDTGGCEVAPGRARGAGAALLLFLALVAMRRALRQRAR